jgi:hypothetical protein
MAVRFDAATDRISFSGTVPDPSSGFTLLGWAYVSVDRDDFSTMARVHASSGASTTATFATGSEGLGGPGYFTAGGSVTNATGFAVGSWRKVAISCTGTTGKCYVATDGGATEVDSGTVGGAASPTGITLGGRSPVDGAEWWNGRLAYWRLYSAELTQTEIETEWASATPVRTENLWADWPLSTHTDLTDHSGNGRNLSAGSTATTTEDGPPLAVDVIGTATGSGGGTGTATGVREVVGVAVGGGGGTGSATGVRECVGVAAGQGGGSGTAAGVREVVGSATGSGGGVGAIVVPSNVVTPAERTYVVPAESRVYAVPAESRTLEVV